jgi:hypothetical protein
LPAELARDRERAEVVTAMRGEDIASRGEQLGVRARNAIAAMFAANE